EATNGGGRLSPKRSKFSNTWKPVPSVFSLKTVPCPSNPPVEEVPYKVLLDKINPLSGCAPSWFWPPPVKVETVVNPLPSVFSLKIVPLPKTVPAVPPPQVVPYKVLLDKTRPYDGAYPSLPPVKL